MDSVAQLAHENDDARLIGEDWHVLACRCTGCVFARKDHADRIADFHRGQDALEQADTERILGEWDRGCVEGWEDYISRQTLERIHPSSNSRAGPPDNPQSLPATMGKPLSMPSKV